MLIYEDLTIFIYENCLLDTKTTKLSLNFLLKVLFQIVIFLENFLTYSQNFLFFSN